MTDLAHVLRGVGRATGPADPLLDEALAALPPEVTSVTADEPVRALTLGVTGVTARDLLALCGPRSDVGGLPLPDGTLLPAQVHDHGGVTVAGYRTPPGDAVHTVVAVWPGAGGGPELHPRSGTLRVRGRVVGPATTRLAADTYRLAGHARWTDTGNDRATLHVEEDGWLVSLHYAAERLSLVTLYAKEPPVRDHDDAAERRRGATHDAWLAGAAGDHEWGDVWSGFDERAGVSEVRVRYRARFTSGTAG